MLKPSFPEVSKCLESISNRMKWCRSVLLIQSGMNKAVDFFIALWIKSPDSVTVPVNQTNFIAESLVIWWKELYCWFWSPVCDGSSSKMKFVWYSFFYGVQSYIINYICNIMMHNVLVVGLQHCSLYNSGIYYSIFWSHWGKMLITMKITMKILKILDLSLESHLHTLESKYEIFK